VTDPSKAVFLSYASQDVQAANRLCEALRAGGIEVWFDRSELRGGDVWDQKIRREIRDCALFIPLVSANTAARAEGYFRLEWSLADARSHMIARNKAFIVPVCLNSTPESGADVPESFQRVQWTRLPDGDTPPAFTAHIAALLDVPVAGSGLTSARVTAPGKPPATPAKPTLRVHVAVIALIILLLVGLAYIVFERFEFSKQPPADRPSAAVVPNPAVPAIPEKSIAVLPFVDMSEKKDQEYFSDGLSEELIDMLTKVPELRVPARTSSFYFKGKQATVSEIAKALGVAHVLEGSVRKSGDKIRITAQLIRVDTGYHEWSQTFDRRLGDIFQIQDDISLAVVSALNASLSASTRRGGTTNADAYALYFLARSTYEHANTEEGLRKVIDELQEATRLDPSFSRAWAFLSSTWSTMGGYGFVAPRIGFERARDAAQKAVTTDPAEPFGHRALAKIYYLHDWDWQRAASENALAMGQEPNDPSTVLQASIIAMLFGRTDEAIQYARKSIDADPLNSSGYNQLGLLLTRSGQFDEAQTAFRQVQKLDPDYLGAHYFFGVALVLGGRPEAALIEFDEDAGRALAYFALGRRTESDTALSAAERAADADPYQSAQVHAYRGEADHAFDWLDRSYTRRSSDLPFVKTDPLFKKLSLDPRFKAFLRRMNLPE
jgi:TolB-like protein